MQDELLFSVTVMLVCRFRRVADRKRGIRTLHDTVPVRLAVCVWVWLPLDSALLLSISPLNVAYTPFRNTSIRLGVTRCVWEMEVLADPSSNGLNDVARSRAITEPAVSVVTGPFRKVRVQLNRPEGHVSVVPVVCRNPVGPLRCWKRSDVVEL